MAMTLKGIEFVDAGTRCNALRLLTLYTTRRSAEFETGAQAGDGLQRVWRVKLEPQGKLFAACSDFVWFDVERDKLLQHYFSFLMLGLCTCCGVHLSFVFKVYQNES